VATILIVTWDAGGNVAPALGIAAELRTRGHRVRVLGHAALRERVLGRHLDFHPYRHGRAWQPGARLSNRRAELAYLAMCVDRGVGRDVTEVLAQAPADLVVVDCMLFGALTAVRRLGVRHVSLVHTLYAYMRDEFGRGFVNLAGTVRGMPPRRLWDGADLALVATAPSLEPTAPLPPNARVIGPVIPPVVAAEPTGRVLVSLSSLYYPGQLETLQSIVDAVADLPAPVVVTTGHAVRPEEIRAPSSVDVRAFVPHDEVMAGAALLIGHGGHSTAMQALANDLPMVILPMFDRSDQPLVGRLLQRAGAGAVVPRQADAAPIRSAVERMLAPGPHREAAARLGAEVRAHPGAQLGADEVEKLLGRTGTS
jgi:UDP:flavonoid glycosyltransferase YjiC (YdhE family)